MSACRRGVDGDGGEQPLAVGGERDGDGVLARAGALPAELGGAVAQRVGEQVARAGRWSAAGASTPPAAASSSARLTARARRRTPPWRPRRGRRRRRARAPSRRRGGAAPPRPRRGRRPRAGSARRRCRTRRARGSSRRARRPCAASTAVARRMMSSEVGPPSSIVAAWMTQRAGMSPAVVSTASPRPIGAFCVGLALDLGAAGARDRARDAAAVGEVGVGRVGDRVDLERRDVGVEHLDRGHDGYGTRMATVRRRVVAHGKVQGVFFRDSTREEAERRGVDRLGAQHADRARSRPSSRASPTWSTR